MIGQRVLFFLFLVANQAVAFSIGATAKNCQQLASCTTRPAAFSSRLWQSSEDDATAVTPDKEENRSDEGQVPAPKAWMVPLFIKFCGVLLVKFFKDVVVFPALYVYRFFLFLKSKIIKTTDPDEGNNEPKPATA